MAKYLLGIDNGGTVAKAALFDLAGKEIAVASGKTPALSPQAGWDEKDTEKRWQATVESIKQALMEHGPVSVAVYVNSAFQGYSEGVFNGCGSGQVTSLQPISPVPPVLLADR